MFRFSLFDWKISIERFGFSFKRKIFIILLVRSTVVSSWSVAFSYWSNSFLVDDSKRFRCYSTNFLVEKWLDEMFDWIENEDSAVVLHVLFSKRTKQVFSSLFFVENIFTSSSSCNIRMFVIFPRTRNSPQNGHKILKRPLHWGSASMSNWHRWQRAVVGELVSWEFRRKEFAILLKNFEIKSTFSINID